MKTDETIAQASLGTDETLTPHEEGLPCFVCRNQRNAAQEALSATRTPPAAASALVELIGPQKLRMIAIERSQLGPSEIGTVEFALLPDLLCIKLELL